MREGDLCLPVFPHAKSSPGTARCWPARGRCGWRVAQPQTWGTPGSRKVERPPAPARTSMPRGRVPQAAAGHEPGAAKVNGKREVIQQSPKRHSCSSSSSSITLTPPFPGWAFLSLPSTPNSLNNSKTKKNTSFLKKKKNPTLLTPKIFINTQIVLSPSCFPEMQGNVLWYNVVLVWLYFF